MDDLGAPPEDDPGTPGDGAPDAGIPPQLSERARSLAERIDAAMADTTESAIHRMPMIEDGIEEIEEVSEVTQLPSPPPRNTLAFRAPPPPVAPPPVPTRPGVVVVPPRVPAMPAAKLGTMTAKPPMVPRATAPSPRAHAHRARPGVRRGRPLQVHRASGVRRRVGMVRSPGRCIAHNDTRGLTRPYVDSFRCV